MGKRKNVNMQEDEDENEVKELNKETTAFISCRKFVGMKHHELKSFIESKGYIVKLVKKTPKQTFGLVDVGCTEIVENLISKLNRSSYKDSVIIVDFMKKEPTETKQNEIIEDSKRIPLLDRLICIRGVSKYVSKKTIMSLFKKVESVIIPTQKSNELRDVLVLFANKHRVARAIRDFQGYELAGRKLVIESLVAVPAKVNESDLLAGDDEEDDDGKKKKKTEQQEKKKPGNKKAAKEEDDDDDDEEEEDDEMDIEEGDDDDDEENDDDDDEDDEEEEVAPPPKKMHKKK